jgi:hypothetical protein
MEGRYGTPGFGCFGAGFWSGTTLLKNAGASSGRSRRPIGRGWSRPGIGSMLNILPNPAGFAPSKTIPGPDNPSSVALRSAYPPVGHPQCRILPSRANVLLDARHLIAQCHKLSANHPLAYPFAWITQDTLAPRRVLDGPPLPKFIEQLPVLLYNPSRQRLRVHPFCAVLSRQRVWNHIL